MSSPTKMCLLSAIFKTIFVCLGFGIVLTNGEVVCSAKMNVGFALDGSHKMGLDNFASAIELAANVSNYLDVESSKTWIFLAYGQHKKVFKTKLKLDSLTPANEPFPGTTGVHLGTTLDAIRKQLNDDVSQRGAINVVFLITSHNSNDDVAVHAALLKASNATVFALGVGPSYSKGQLREIASNPNSEHVIGLSSWNGVNQDLVKSIARKICQVVDSCVSSPCHNNGTCISSEVGYSCRCPVEFYGEHCEKSRSVEYLSVGCFNDDAHVQAIHSLESENATYLDGSFQARKETVLKCALESAKNGFHAFAVQNGGACFSDADAQNNYTIYGTTSCPGGGKGGHLVNEVYLLGAKCGKMVRDSLIHLSKSTIRGSSYNAPWGVPLVDGDYSWCPNDSDAHPYSEVDLGRKTYLTKMSVQGKKDALYSADSICVNYTLDGQNANDRSSCSLFKEHFSGKSGNYIYPHTMSPPVLAQSVRLASSTNKHGGHCIRTEVEGCVTTVTDGEEVTKGCYKTQRNKCCVFPFWYQGRQIYSCIKDNHNQPWCATTDSYDRDQLWDNCQGLSGPCDTVPCQNGGTCIGNVQNWSYQCRCSEYLSNENCQDDYDECFNSPCQNGGTCVNTFGGYRCECNHGYSGGNCYLGCSHSKVELGFVLDGSTSGQYYGKGNLQMMKDFMKNLTRSFNVSSGETRVGVIVYSTNSTLVFKLDQYSSYEEVKEAIDNISYPGGGTNTGKALNDAAVSLYMNGLVRDNVHKVLVVITDGVSVDDVTGPATLLKDNGVLVFVVGIGEYYDHSQLTQIANGKQDYVFAAEGNSLGLVTNRIRGTICKEIDKGCSDNPCHFNGICQNGGFNCTCAAGFRGDRCSEDVKECAKSAVNCASGKRCTEAFGGHECTCADTNNYGEHCNKDCTKDSTILFLLDKSTNVGEDNIKHQVEFVISVASTLSYRNIGVISYASNAHLVIRPGQSSHFSEFANTLRAANHSMGKFKNLGAALAKAMQEQQLFYASKATVIVAMIAGKTEDEHAVPAALLKRKGVTIIGLALGSSYSMSQLNLLVSNPGQDHLLLSQFDNLKHFISTTRDTICKASNPCSDVQCSSSEICMNKYGEYAGHQCITHGCSLSPCKNGGNCTVDSVGSYSCECPPGIGGQNCTEDVVNECDSAPCRNGGTCKDLLGRFECDCPQDYSGRQCEFACVSQKFNLVFVVDGSGSIEYQGRGNFQRSKDFIIEIVKSFSIGKHETNVALVLYSKKAQIVFNLKKYYKSEDIVRAIQRMSYPGGGTKTGKALDAVRKHAFKGIPKDRKSVPKVVMVLTDGLSQDDVSGPARKLRDDGATIISLGVGCCYDENELKEMATDPDEKHVLEVSFTALDEYKDAVREQICSAVDFCSSDPCLNGGTCIGLPGDFQCQCTPEWQGKDCGTDADECALNITQCPDGQVCHNFPGGSTCLCTNNRYGENCSIQCKYTELDVAFLLDSSGSINNAGKENYQIMKDFIKGIVKSFIIGQNDTTVAVATFSSRGHFKIRFDFTKYFGAPQIVAAIENVPYDGGLTYTGDALTRLKTDLFPLARPGVPHILIVLTDGRSHDSVASPAQYLRDMGVHIISVGVGNADYQELQEIATDPDNENVFTASFDSVVMLTGSILEDVCKAVDHCLSNPCRNNGTCHNALNEYNCTCLSGFMGKSCDDVDYCHGTPCKNNGTCYNLVDNYKCACSAGFKGNSCEAMDHCFDTPCKNNGTCYSVSDSHTCTCPAGFTGRNCEAVDHCHNSPCKNNGTCSNIGSSFNCVCIGGFIGETCEAIDYCHNSPCKNSGTCQNLLERYSCQCSAGFKGESCEDVDYCFDSPCQNNGTCTDLLNNYTCACSGQFEGPNCEEINHCYSSPCRNNGTCQNSLDEYRCDCHAKFSGRNCEQELDECSSRPCLNNGTCYTDLDNYRCACPAGFTGQNCEVVDHCFSDPCLNNGSCINSADKYQCNCLSGFKGSSCEVNDYCYSSPCQNNGTCNNLQDSYSCDCPVRYTGVNCEGFRHSCPGVYLRSHFERGEGPMCEVSCSRNCNPASIDHCYNSPCKNNGSCQNQPDRFNCACSAGFTGETCDAVDYCFDSPCQNNATCSNIPNNYTCACSGQFEGRNCEVINYCYSSPCRNNGTCQNSLVDYRCFCYAKFSGRNCEQELDECSSSPCMNNGTCSIDLDNYRCTCPVGFTGQNCEAVDHCYSNPCLNNGSCINSADNYQCNCLSGFKGISCEENDYCHSSPCQNNGTCNNLQDSYSCDCPAGYTGVNCEEINHCYQSPCRNNGTCQNNLDDYRCVCHAKFSGRDCEQELDECSRSPCLNNGTCYSDLDNYRCVCPAGFTGQNCEAVDHCYSDPCLKNGSCINSADTFQCICLPGFKGSNCEENDYCYSSPCQNNGTCNNLPESYLCDCPLRYTGVNCEDVDYCFDSPCQNNGTCNNLPNNYTCACSEQFEGRNCEERNYCYSSPCRNNGTCQNSLDAYRCICHAKFSGKTCEQELDECSSSPCLNNGTCYSDLDNYRCACPAGFTGQNCEVLDHCHNSPCKNNGTCSILGNSFNCDCPERFIGETCEEEDYCHNSPCKNGATCQNLPDRYTCDCPPGFLGQNCEELDHCYDEPCLNNGSCVNSADNYQCTCLEEFTGINCEAKNVCRSHPCINGGMCSVSGDHYKCDCPNGLTGTNCELDIDECFNSPCLNDASGCTNTFGSYECNCATGYTGIHCQIGIPTNGFDVLLLFDGSSYLGSNHFHQTLLFAKAVLLNYNISQTETNVAAAVYSNNVTISFSFIEHYSYLAVASAIDKIPFLDETPLDIENALNIARHDIFPTGRPNVPDVLVSFVSFSLSGNFAVISQTLRDEGVKIIAIGIGSSFYIPQLEEVASTPTTDYLVTTSYQHMDTKENAVGGAVCQAVDPCSTSPCLHGGNCTGTRSNYTCSCPIGLKGHSCEQDINECMTGVTDCKNGKRCVNTWGGYQCICPGDQYGKDCEHGIDTELDFVFLIDGSQVVTKENFIGFISFTKAITASLNVSKEKTHVSVTIYGDAPVMIVNDSYNQSSIEHALDNVVYPGSLQSNLGEALLHIASKLYNKSDTRPNVTRVLVILTASKCHDDITVPSNLLLKHFNVKVFVIAVGNQYSHGQLNEVSSNPDSDYVFTFNSGQDISVQIVAFKENVSRALDPCSSDPCRNGTCSSTRNGYKCRCYSGYSGPNCDKVNDPCNPEPCKNHGTCQVLPLNSYYCACPTGWTGANCEEDVKECSLPYNVCQNGGTCEERIGDYYCNCALGYAGKICDKVFNETMIDLVFMIDGSSIHHQTGENSSDQIVQVIKFTLSYLPNPNTRVGLVLYAADAKIEGYFNYTRNQTYQVLDILPYLPKGTSIGKSLNYTREHFFNNSRPNTHRVLVVFTDKTSNDVVSVASKSLRDMNVTIIVVALGDWYDITQVNNIASNPHSATTLFTTYVEIVKLRWRVHEMICEAVDHCFNNPCANNRTCYNSLHGYQCACPEGFTGSFCEEVIDQCDLNNTCLPQQICISRIGSYDCVCPEGYYGKQCDEVEDKDKCSSSPCINGGTCVNVGRSYRCDCNRGFYGRLCQFGCGFRELGLKVPNTRRIPDKDITASSRRVEGRSAYRGRIGVEVMGSWEDGWCSSPTDTAPYIQVFFGYLTNVTAIETEGVTDDSTGIWVESYYVSTSNSSEAESFVNYTEGGNTILFKANENINGKNVSLNGTSAHYIRIHPLTYQGTSACLRIAMYGCDSEDFPSLGVLLQSSDDKSEDESSGFDIRLAVIPAAVIFIALLTGALIFFLRSYRKKHSGKLKGYLEIDEDEGIYQTIPFDMPMYEVQTVAVEMGPEKSVAENGRGIWWETTFSLSRPVQRYHNAVYDKMDTDKQGYETQTLTVDVGTDAVAREVSYETSIASEKTTSLSDLSFETQLTDEIYYNPFDGHISTDVEEQEQIYDFFCQNLTNEEDDDDIYDNVFPEAPSHDAQRMTLELARRKTVLKEGIFSEDNKIFGFNRVNTLPSRDNTLKRGGNTLPNGKNTTLPNGGISNALPGRNASPGGRNTMPSGRNTSKQGKNTSKRGRK